jgi:hypothetical protein
MKMLRISKTNVCQGEIITSCFIRLQVKQIVVNWFILFALSLAAPEHSLSSRCN